MSIQIQFIPLNPDAPSLEELLRLQHFAEERCCAALGLPEFVVGYPRVRYLEGAAGFLRRQLLADNYHRGEDPANGE